MRKTKTIDSVVKLLRLQQQEYGDLASIEDMISLIKDLK
jgi:hypothetical protein